MSYIVYVHTNKLNNKSYVGYTKLGISKRLQKHCTNAASGIDNKFYRALRKYGVAAFESKILFESDDKNEATDKEIEFIEIYDSFKVGYNSTIGGDGGWVVQDKEQWLKNQMCHVADENPRWCGFSNQQLIDIYYYYSSNNESSFTKMILECSEIYSTPKSFSKNRMTSSELKSILCEMNIIFTSAYFRSDEQKKKLSEQNTGKFWYHNDILKQSKQLKNPTNDWERGRVKYGN